MKDLYTYITEENINEGLFKSSLGFIYIKRMEPSYLLNGILNMYEYIIDKSDIKLFYEDFPIKERPFWANLYKLYESKLWSIFDTTKSSNVSDEQKDDIDSCFDQENELIDVTPEFRRKLRFIIKDSSNPQDDLNATNVNKIMLINDPQFDKRYIFTINKITGLFRKGLKAADIKMLENLFKKISEI